MRGVQLENAKMLTAHRIAKAYVDKLTKEDVPDGSIYDAAVRVEIAAMAALVNAPCANDDMFFENAAYILENADGDEHEEQAAIELIKNYLKQRARSQ
jgi:hypothetical protein